MATLYRYLIPAMWIGWAVYWWIASHTVKLTARNESLSSRLSYICPLVLATFLLLVHNIPVPILRERFVPHVPWSFAIAASLTAAGLLFAVWARRHLGTNWSGTVTIKEGHQLITTGPYAIVRHPIYTGLLLAIVGTAIAIGEWRTVLAVALALLSNVHKLRLEERWMNQNFGDAYRAYCQRIPALIPFIL
jgi:protein-S-isoprenylcysteine O-methyltransferase Ste14